MLKRTITGGCYALTICAFFLLREFVDCRLFTVLIFLFCSIGTFEIARAEKPNLIKGNFIAIIIYGGLLVPLYCVLQYVFNFGYLVLALPILFGLSSIRQTTLSFESVAIFISCNIIRPAAPAPTSITRDDLSERATARRLRSSNIKR